MGRAASKRGAEGGAPATGSVPFGVVGCRVGPPAVLGMGIGFTAIMFSIVYGALMGLLGALALGRLLSGYLLGVATTDALSLVGMPIVLGIVAAVAALIPARRACRIDPGEAMRAERVR